MGVLKLVLAYDGTDFHGWARQPGVRTVEGAIEEALTGLVGRAPRLSVAGRTDAGVHAEGQVASFPAPAGLDPTRVQRTINGRLAPEVVVLSASVATDSFDARHSATGREYRYRIDTRAVPDPFTARYAWHRPGDLSFRDMRGAARFLEGEHDFASFCRAPKLPASTVRTLRRLSVRRAGHLVEVHALADRFLHQMVRSLVGTLVRVGQGRLAAEAIPAILAARDRAAAGPVAPPHGLALVKVMYGRR
ncbi:MAG: tRNA pseudouridine(38-40) synthase TruA [Actinobacteria bacterium]|nr:MAG: tRNA pseudouridine(38-40) synthase TruA [Actinomycetota bacterium]